MSPDTAQAVLAADQYRCPPIMRFPMGSEAQLLYFPLTKEAKLVSPAEAGLLTSCGQFATFESHAERVLKSLPPGSADAPGLVEMLKGFAEGGMMLSLGDLMKRVASFPKPDPPPKIAWLAIPTCNRPDLLRRCIKSFGEHFRKYGRFPKLLVADDSNTPENRSLTKAVAEEASRTWGAFVLYLGLEEKLRLIDRLAAGGDIPREALEFGILGPGGPAQGAGANRNCIMLHTLGDLVLSVDDDTVCEPYAAPEPASAALRFGAELDPQEYWFFPDRQSALGFIRPADIDILAEHERMLGRAVCGLLRSADGSGCPDVAGACGHLIRSLWDGQGSVFVTSNGSVGDSGMYSGRKFPQHRGAETRSRLLASEEGYRAALRSREILRQAPSPAVSHGGALISMFFGMDNRRSLPPFFPVGHCDDGIFAYVSGRCIDGCYLGHLPWALIHDPPPGRAYFGKSAATLRISDLVIACASIWSDPGPGATSQDRITSLGKRLGSLARLSPSEFGEQIRFLVWQQAGQRLMFKEALLREHHERPDFWAADLRCESADTLAALAEESYCAPADLPACEDRTGQAQNALQRYSRLLSWWPALAANSGQPEPV